ncbi:MAG: hypothetical protein ACYDBB_07360 [Armatimonadota bacterium]
MKKLFVLGVAMILASAAFAYPTLTGPTGGFQVPTADTAQGVQVAMDRFEGAASAWPNTQLLWGALPNLELGIGYAKGIDNFKGVVRIASNDEATWNLDAKYALPLAFTSGKLAIGAGYQKYESFDINTWNVYVAGTWVVFGDMKFTGVIIHQDLEFDNNTDFLVALAKPFANGAELGAELDLNPAGDDAPFFVRGADSRKLLLYTPGGVFANVYYIFPVNDNVSARVALAGLGQATTWNLSAAYTFGK